jgi:hypothetical protein
VNNEVIEHEIDCITPLILRYTERERERESVFWHECGCDGACVHCFLLACFAL